MIVLFTGHLLSTSTFDLLAWTAVTWLAVRAIRTGDDRLWIAAGVVLGVGLLNKPLPAFLAAALLIGVAFAGPRELLRNRWVWAGALIALVLWSPWLIWQQANDWPQIDVSKSITEMTPSSAVARPSVTCSIQRSTVASIASQSSGERQRIAGSVPASRSIASRR